MSDESTDDAPDTPSARRMKRALRDVRREGWKAAVIYAVVDAAVLFLAVNLALTALDPPSLPTQVVVPSALTDLLGPSYQGATLPVAALVGAVVGLLVLVVETWLRVRRPLVERFERANPSVAEALRTARDAVDSGADTRMAARLYEDVLDRLGGTSGVALVDTRRIAGTVVVAVVLSLLTLQATAAGVALLDGDGGGQTANPSDDGTRDYTGLEDPDAVLGDVEDVNAGDEDLTARVDSTGGDEEVDRDQQFPSTSPGGSDASGVESQQAGFAGADQVEDAELIREYNLRIREEEDNT